jgi:hypothetical protein
MYLHCHSCGWEQDDFWEHGYLPIRKQDVDMIEKWLKEPDGQQIVVSWLLTEAKTVLNMRWKTHEEWKNEKDQVCPTCGSSAMDID